MPRIDSFFQERMRENRGEEAKRARRAREMKREQKEETWNEIGEREKEEELDWERTHYRGYGI